MIKPDVEQLLSLGFIRFAKWQFSTKNNEKLAYSIVSDHTHLLDGSNALYAFASGGEVLYIGKTTQSIKKRFMGYIVPGKKQSTNIKCHQNIKNAIGADKTIDILIFVPVTHFQYGDFSINLAAGLEDSLISKFAPEWNYSSQGKTFSETEEMEKNVNDNEGKTLVDNVDTVYKAASQNGYKNFSITLKETYYQKGIINAGVSSSKFLAKHDEHIIVYLGSLEFPVTTKINRMANQNGSPRFIGNNHLMAEWFQKNFSLGETVDAQILDSHHVFLKAK